MQPHAQYLPATQPPHALPQLRDPDGVPAADQRAEGQRRHAVEPARARELEHRHRPVSRRRSININNAARNLVEIIANAARADTGGDYPIRIYTIGMGELVRTTWARWQETSESILKRIANDKTSPDFNSTQLEGKYYFASDGGRRRPGVPAAAEPDHPAE